MRREAKCLFVQSPRCPYLDYRLLPDSTASYKALPNLDARQANNLPKTAIMVTATTTIALQKGHAKKTPPKKPHQQKASKTKACYNCHRKRLRCDKSLPSCLKCSINGEECLGYGIVLRWAACNSPTSTSTARATNNKPNFNTKTTTSRTVNASTPVQASTPSSPPQIVTEVTTIDESIDSFTLGTPVDNNVETLPQAPDDNQESSSQIITRPINFIKIPLTDPLLNGLSSKEKWYMHHCKSFSFAT